MLLISVVLTNVIYAIMIVFYLNFMSQISNFSVKYDTTHRTDYRFQMSHLSNMLYVLNDTYFNASLAATLQSTSYFYTFRPYEVKNYSYYVNKSSD